MNVELLIYIYLFVCIAMIFFNIVCVFVFQHNDKQLDRHSVLFTEKVRRQIEKEEEREAHLQYLTKKLRRIGNLMAFDKTLEQMYAQDPAGTQAYIESIYPAFVSLAQEYRKRSKLQAAYFPYLIKKYGIFRGQTIRVISDTLLEMVRDPNLYCRENALQALYAIGNAETVVEALEILDAGPHYHHAKLITDGLMGFSGDTAHLGELLWLHLSKLSAEMRVAILNYFRFSSGDYCPQMLRLMTDNGQDNEVRYCCIRYFGKYRYDPAYPYLLDFLENEREENWEYAAIAATALSSYPSERSVEILKEKLSSVNWYVRFNAAQSLAALGVGYMQLVDVFEGSDRYADEMIRYRLDQKRMREMEGKPDES